METKNNVPTYHARNRAAWREWLEKHHETQKSVWLIIYHKKSTTPSVYYDEAVEEALCFGWIDSKPNKRDKESSYLFFSQRNPKSNWSALNKRRVAKLSEKGLIKSAGQAMIDLAKKTGTWDALDVVDKRVIPDDLKKEFDQWPGSAENFAAFSPSTQKGILEWILNAKRPETRQTRIQQTAQMASKNEKANQYIPKK